MPETARPSAERPRFHFLDGLRGLAALYVVLYHEVLINQEAPLPTQLSAPLQAASTVLGFGHFAVVFFIVLSGFSLMLPVVSAGVLRVSGGLAAFAMRRASRILPAYYAALVFSMAAIALYQVAAPLLHMRAPHSDAALSIGSVVSHVLLLHNLSFDRAFLINAPMWSIATEWQIYFAFALLLLPAWKKLGPAPTVLLAFALGCAPLLVLPSHMSFAWACPWFLGSFSLGMWAAWIADVRPEAGEDRWGRIPLGLLAWLGFGGVVAAAAFSRVLPLALTDAVVSVFAFLVLSYCVTRARRGERSWVLRVLESRALVSLGGFSYSLYLIQHPFLRLTGNVLAKLGLSRDLNLLVQLFGLTAILLGVAKLFAHFFERPLRLVPRRTRARTGPYSVRPSAA